MAPNPNIKILLSALPHKPGIYQYYDATGKLIYVGKAKDLKKRVSSYFSKTHDSTKLNILVAKITNIEYIVVATEFDALLLENNLIKKYQPRYNVLLKDDKTYPWICIKNERFPRVFSTRNIIKDGSEYFGPYSSVKMMNTLLDLIRHLYQLRTCSHNLSPENIKNGKYSVCLKFHIKNCLGPCEGFQLEEEYNETIRLVREILKGNLIVVIKYLKSLMLEYAQALKYEKAQIVKVKLELLENFQSKSTIVNPLIHNIDVYSIESDEKFAYVNFLKIINGAIIQGHTIEIQKRLDESNAELLEFAITNLRERFKSESKEILIPIEIDLEIPDVKFSIPLIGDKKRLMELSERNVKYYKAEHQKQRTEKSPLNKFERVLTQMKKDLGLPSLPYHIECFDNSNIQGTDAVAAMVVFRNAKPAKSDYRHYNIKTVVGPDDFASMEEVVFRRYRRLIDEQKSLPQLIVIDGGKGQLGMAVKSLTALGIADKVNVIGIAKKLEEIYKPGDSFPLYLDKKSETLRIIQQIRDEAHRFGITHHRNKRSKHLAVSELDSIAGIGPKTKTDLLKTFKSVKNIREASKEDIEKIIGKAKANLVLAHFSK